MMALRALRGGGANNNLTVFGLGRMSIWANSANTSRQFFLARATSGVAGKTLRLQLFDIGDAQGNGQLTILPPTDSNVTGGRFANCTGTVSSRTGQRLGGEAGPGLGRNCSTTSTTGTSSGAATNYNGKVLTFRVPIPKGYTCNDADPNGLLDQDPVHLPPAPARRHHLVGLHRGRPGPHRRVGRPARRQTRTTKRPAGPWTGGALRRAVKLSSRGSAATQSLAQAAARPNALRAPGQLGGHEQSGSDHAGRARRAGHRNQLLVNAGCVGRRGDPLNR